MSRVHSTAVIWSPAQLHWLEVFQTNCKGVNQCLIPTKLTLHFLLISFSQSVYCLCTFPDFAFCLECFILFFLHMLLPTLFITSLSYTFCHIQSWAHFYGCNNRQGLLGCLGFENCELFMKTKSYHASLEHNFTHIY
jgi:hypothetical protein